MTPEQERELALLMAPHRLPVTFLAGRNELVFGFAMVFMRREASSAAR